LIVRKLIPLSLGVCNNLAVEILWAEAPVTAILIFDYQVAEVIVPNDLFRLKTKSSPMLLDSRD
jgi:hypothetical protein